LVFGREWEDVNHKYADFPVCGESDHLNCPRYKRAIENDRTIVEVIKDNITKN